MSEFTCFPKVHIISDTKSSISEDWITAVAKQSLKPYKFIRDCELNIVIADDKLLKSLIDGFGISKIGGKHYLQDKFDEREDYEDMYEINEIKQNPKNIR